MQGEVDLHASHMTCGPSLGYRHLQLYRYSSELAEYYVSCIGSLTVGLLRAGLEQRSRGASRA